MMYLHYCKTCVRIHLLNGHKMNCPRCNQKLIELRMPYTDYVSLTIKERTLFLELCRNETSLKELSTTYRMYKYSKWYRKLQACASQNQDPLLSDKKTF